MTTSALVLVVEDEKIVGADIRENLRALGYSVSAVLSSGEEAITSATENRPDLVLMDIQLKGRIDGIDAAKIVQSRLNIPVVYITAFADDATLQRAKGSDPYGFILKPFGKKELQTAIEIALHKYGRERRLRTNEDWLMSMLKSMPSGVLAVDRSGSVCLMNPAAERITGGALEDALGAHWSDVIEFLPRREPGSPESPLAQALERGEAIEVAHSRVRFPRVNRKATLMSSTAPITGSNSEASGAVFVFYDITGAEQGERQYYHKRHLEGLQRLAGGLAHNLNNVLAIISGYSEALMRSAPDDSASYRDAAIIQQSAEKAAGLTHQLLSFSRRAPGNPKPADMNALISGQEQLLASTLGPGIEVSRKLDPHLGQVLIDAGHLEHILMTLVVNARDAMPGGGVLTIRTCNLDLEGSAGGEIPPGSYACLEVSDTGGGMGEEIQTHLFEPFFTTKERAKGAGLNLSVAYGLAQQAGGHLLFESAPGQGSRFCVCLPRLEQVPDRPRTALKGAYRGAETILIVDKEPHSRRLMRDTLLHLGYQVLEAQNGDDAVKVCEDAGRPVHLVLSEIPAPSLGGRELAGRLSNSLEAKILFVSAHSPYALQHYGGVEPNSPILQKPFTAEALAAKVRQVLDAG